MPVLNVHPDAVIPSGAQQPLDPALILRSAGLLLHIEIGLPDPLIATLNAQNLPIPASQHGLVLLDTGATISGIHEPIAKALNLQPTGPVMLGGVAGGHQP